MQVQDELARVVRVLRACVRVRVLLACVRVRVLCACVRVRLFYACVRVCGLRMRARVQLAHVSVGGTLSPRSSCHSLFPRSFCPVSSLSL